MLARLGAVEKIAFAAGAVALAVNHKGLRDAAKMPFAREGEASSRATAIGVALLWAADRLVGRALRAAGSPFPSSVATILATWVCFSAAELTAGTAATDSALRALGPGVEFLGKWMLVSIAVPLTSIPLSIRGGGQWLRLVALTVGGWLFTLSSTAAAARLCLGSTAGDGGPEPAEEADAAKPDPAAKAAQAALAAERAASNRAAWNNLTAVSLVAVPFVGVAPAQFCGTILSLLHAQRVPTRFVRVGAHPLLLCAGAASALCAVAAHTHAISFEAALDLFRTQNGTFAGPGDTLFELMNASLVALGLQATSFCVAFLEAERRLKATMASLWAGARSASVAFFFATSRPS